VKKQTRRRLELAGFAALVTVAVLFALPSVGWPLDAAQNSSFELAKRWWQENAIPYRDTADIRPPGIHFLRLLAGLFFGVHPRSLRILELIAVIAAGMSAAHIAAKKRLSPLALAPAMLISAVFYFTLTGPANSGIAEIWAALCLLSAQSTISVDKNRRRAAIVSGLWTGCALVLLPATIVFAPLFLTQVLRNALADRPEPEKTPTLFEIPVAFFIGLFQPPGFFAAYFVTRRSFLPLWHSIRETDPTLLNWHALTMPRAFVIPAAIAAALWLPSLIAKRGRTIAPLLWLCAVLTTLLHPSPTWFVLFIPFLTLIAADGLVWLAERWLPLPSLIALAVTAFFWLSKAG
jgi:hypothetical protein